MKQDMAERPFATEFAKVKEKMIATSQTAYDNFTKQYRGRIKEYKPEEIQKILLSGSLVDQQKLSRTFFLKDGFYRDIIIYYATLLCYVGILIPSPSFGKSLSENHIQKRYSQALTYVENMHLPVFLPNCALKALINGSYFGLITKLDKNTFTVIDLPAEFCCTRFKDIYGNDIIEFNLTYFDSIKDSTERKNALSVYPKVVRNAYNAYKRDPSNTDKWVVIPSDIGICFPFFDGRPPFLQMLEAALKYDAAVDTDRERDLEEIRKIIVQHIPHLSDGRLVFEPDEAKEIHDGTVGMLKGNPNISVLTTYADVDAVQSQTTSDASRNSTLKQMLHNIYANAGVSEEIFAATGSTTLPTSLKKDLALMMTLANKFSVFVTYIVNAIYQNSNVTFKYQILPISYYNVDDYVKETLSLASSGYSFLLPALALGISQKDLGNIKDLENDVLKLGDKLIPLKSSYTNSSNGSSDDEGGRPVKTAEEKSEKTIENEKSLDNTTDGGSN